MRMHHMWTNITVCANAHTCCEVFLVPAQSKERQLCLCAVLARTSYVLRSRLRRLCINNDASLIWVLRLWRNMMCIVDCLHLWSCTRSSVFPCCVPLQQSEANLSQAQTFLRHLRVRCDCDKVWRELCTCVACANICCDLRSCIVPALRDEVNCALVLCLWLDIRRIRSHVSCLRCNMG